MYLTDLKIGPSVRLKKCYFIPFLSVQYDVIPVAIVWSGFLDIHVSCLYLTDLKIGPSISVKVLLGECYFIPLLSILYDVIPVAIVL